MKKSLLIIGLLLLTGCRKKADPLPLPSPSAASSSSAYSLKAGETQFVYDTKKTKTIHQELYACLSVVANSTEKLIPEQVKAQVSNCDHDYWESIKIKDNPPTFYTTVRQGKGPDPFDEFVLCEHTLADPMMDFPPDESAYTFRETIRDCLNQFPRF